MPLTGLRVEGIHTNQGAASSASLYVKPGRPDSNSTTQGPGSFRDIILTELEAMFELPEGRVEFVEAIFRDGSTHHIARNAGDIMGYGNGLDFESAWQKRLNTKLIDLECIHFRVGNAHATSTCLIEVSITFEPLK